MKQEIKTIEVQAKMHLDSGNTYFSARIYKDGELFKVLPFQYGYGEQYLYETGKALGLNDDTPLWRHCADNSIELIHSADYKTGGGYSERHLKEWAKMEAE